MDRRIQLGLSGGLGSWRGIGSSSREASIERSGSGEGIARGGGLRRTLTSAPLDQESPGSSPGGATRRSDSTSVGRGLRFCARCYRLFSSFLDCAGRSTAHLLDRRRHHLEHRGLAGVLMARQQGRQVLPATGRGHILERQSFRSSPTSAGSVPEATLEPFHPGSRFGLPEIVLTLRSGSGEGAGGLPEQLPVAWSPIGELSGVPQWSDSPIVWHYRSRCCT
jgi:hypothetical protein